MRELVVLGSDKRLSLRQTNLLIKNKAGVIEDVIALGRIESISVFGNPQLSTQLIKALNRHQIHLHYFSISGSYLCSLMSAKHFNYEDQIDQFLACSQSDFCLQLSRRIIESKVHNQKLLLQAYDEDNIFDEGDLAKFDIYIEKIKTAESLQSLRGYEGKAATLYFYYLKWILPHEFHFKTRTKHPAKDPFNSLLGFGYSILYGYFIGQLYKYGLNPGIGIMHQNKRKHACLSSDLMEEWRPIIVDDTVMHFVLDTIIKAEDFTMREDGSCIMNKESKRLFISKINNRLFEMHPFIQGQNMTARYTINQQVESLKRSFKQKDPSLYKIVGGCHSCE